MDFLIFSSLSSGGAIMANNHHVADFGTSEKTFGVYTFGIVLCVIFTLIPFMVVKYKMLDLTNSLWIVFVAAVLQFYIQVKCFLRLHFRSEQGQLNVMSFVYTIFLVLLLVFGSMWIMWNLNYNMMH